MNDPRVSPKSRQGVNSLLTALARDIGAHPDLDPHSIARNYHARLREFHPDDLRMLLAGVESTNGPKSLYLSHRPVFIDALQAAILVNGRETPA